MNFFNISDIKLKVILTCEDCEKYGIDAECSDYSTASVRQSVREILEIAERRSGFSISDDRILVQFYPLPEGECEMFVTRLTNISRRDRATLSASAGMSLMERKSSTYRFSSLDVVKMAVSAVRERGLKCDFYKDDIGRYYIRVKEELTDGISELEILVEYGERLPAFPIAVLSEYGERLAKDITLKAILSYGSSQKET